MTLSCSVIITNHNYGRFVKDAIDSALGQSWGDVEVIVVDDGSSDDSRRVIEQYGHRITPTFQPNGGQGSAFNTGFACSSAEIVVFLDADDLLYTDAIETVMTAFGDRVSKVHWPLDLMDANGDRMAGITPDRPLPRGDFADAVLKGGPTSSLSSPTSGNAWSRWYLERVLPVPTEVYRLCADEYVYTLAPVFGRVEAIQRPLGRYRVHGSNNYAALRPSEKLRLEVDTHEDQCRALETALVRNGIHPDLGAWRRNSWFHRLDQAVNRILVSVPDGASFLLADDDTWETEDLFGDRSVIRGNALSAAGGPPGTDDQALALLQEIRELPYVVFGWPAYWWFDAYPRFFRQFFQRFESIQEDDVVRIFRRNPA